MKEFFLSTENAEAITLKLQPQSSKTDSGFHIPDSFVAKDGVFVHDGIQFFFQTMKRTSIFFVLPATVFLASCVDTTGVNPESTRTTLGNPIAAVRVVEFSDLQCPACRASHFGVTKPIIAQYGQAILFEFKHFPLQSHRYSLEAAQAAECAADQGRFWEFVDTAYEKQDDMNSDAFRDWAGQLNLDTDLFDRCIRSRIKAEIVLKDYEEGRALGVNGTPTYFVNGQKVEGTPEALKSVIDTTLEGFKSNL